MGHVYEHSCTHIGPICELMCVQVNFSTIKEFSLEPQHSFVRFGCCVLASLFFHYISHLRPPSRVSLCALFFFLLLLMFPLSLAEFDKSNDCRGVVLVVMVMVHT